MSDGRVGSAARPALDPDEISLELRTRNFDELELGMGFFAAGAGGSFNRREG